MIKYPLTFNSFDDEDAKAVYELFGTGYLTQGSITKKYESKLCKEFGCEYAVAVNSGSSANLLMISALLYSNNSKYSIKPGDEIIVPAVSWITTYSPLIQLGLNPVVVDVDLKTLNIDIDMVAEKITPKTRAIFAVNLLGNPACLEKLSKLCDKNNLILIEDNCESMGASVAGKKTGTWGCMGSHSTYFSHHITTIEGGFVLTDSKHLYDLLVCLRAHGWARDIDENSEIYHTHQNEENYIPRDFLFFLPGYNLRTTDLNSLLGLRQLEKFDTILENRRKTWNCLSKFSADYSNHIVFQETEENATSSHFGFSMIAKESEKSDELRLNLNQIGFQTRPIVTGNILRHPVSKYFSKKINALRSADKVHYDGVMVTSYLSESQLENSGLSLQQALTKTFCN
jgi:CDP-6-deoxy-D-xylo-4-hexulose-3-dehydrase